MSYDLFFKSREGEFDFDRFAAYFHGRPHYKLESGQAWYENTDTGVYFNFSVEPDSEEEGEHFPVAFNINYFRPSYFIGEAEPEVATFVRQFDLFNNGVSNNGVRDTFLQKRVREHWRLKPKYSLTPFSKAPEKRHIAKRHRPAV